MGSFDQLIDGDRYCQTKMFDCELNTYRSGDEVPFKESFTMVFPDFEGARFGIFQDGIFVKLTNDELETTPPYYTKWGGLIKSPSDIENQYFSIFDVQISSETKEAN